MSKTKLISQRILPMILFGATPMQYNLRHLLSQIWIENLNAQVGK